MGLIGNAAHFVEIKTFHSSAFDLLGRIGNLEDAKDVATLAIDCIAVEDEYGNSPAQRAELDWLLYNKPLEYAQMVLRGEMERYLSLGCDHGRLED